MNKNHKWWYDEMKAKGHTPRMSDWDEEEEDIDMFVVDVDIHNGPGCSTCGWSCCEHCHTGPIPECRSKKRA